VGTVGRAAQALSPAQWPAVILFLLIAYRSEIANTLTSSDIEVAGLKLTKRVETLASDLSVEVPKIIAALNSSVRPQLAESGAKQLDEIETRIANLGRNINQDLVALPGAVAPPVAAAAPRVAAEPPPSSPATAPVAQAVPPTAQQVAGSASVKDWESAGSCSLLSRDAEKAASAFAKAYELWPNYHNVEELRNLLQAKKAELTVTADAQWVELYRLILAKYSWGMPSDVREAMRQQAG
jgi:hypothetical protein